MSTPRLEGPALPASQRLPLTFDVAPLAVEVARIPEEEWLPHYTASDYEGNWSVVPLRSLGGSMTHVRPVPGAELLFDETARLRASPSLRAAISRFRLPLGAVRLLRLQAGSRVREHRDLGLGIAGGEVRLHVPIVTHLDVDFRVEGERIPMAAGECWYVDVSRPHRVDNASPIDRVHLVVDGRVNAWFDELRLGHAPSASTTEE